MKTGASSDVQPSTSTSTKFRTPATVAKRKLFAKNRATKKKVTRWRVSSYEKLNEMKIKEHETVENVNKLQIEMLKATHEMNMKIMQKKLEILQKKTKGPGVHKRIISQHLGRCAFRSVYDNRDFWQRKFQWLSLMCRISLLFAAQYYTVVYISYIC